MTVMDRRALVLGGGGVTGIAWETGLIAGLGIDLAAADVIIGTSAGSLVGTDIACGQDLEALYQAQLAPPAPEPAARIGWAFIGRLLWDVHTSRDPKRARARIGRWALAVSTMPEADRRNVFEDRLPASVWPSRALKVTAVDARTGEFAVFDSAGDASLVDAVGASCAVPGLWPPVTIGERRFMDGGMRTVANADLAHGYERVVIVAPVAAGIGFMASPHRQAPGGCCRRSHAVRLNSARQRRVGGVSSSRRSSILAGWRMSAAESISARVRGQGKPPSTGVRLIRCAGTG